MSLTPYLKKRLVDLLEQKRVVVWYDGEKVFEEVARAFRAPNCTAILAGQSRLRARRQADEVLCKLNDASQPAPAKNGSLLIYCPWPRGRTSEQRAQDPFEGFALVGSAFGDKEAETFQSLARQAMPKRASEIDRLFREGRPTFAIIDGLGERVGYPLLQEALGSDSLVEVSSQLLCHEEAPRKLASVRGADGELLRLLQWGLGFVPPARVTALDSILGHLGRYVLFSEFAFELPGALPEPLSGVARAGGEFREAIYSLCERMRTSTGARASTGCGKTLSSRHSDPALRERNLALSILTAVRDSSSPAAPRNDRPNMFSRILFQPAFRRISAGWKPTLPGNTETPRATRRLAPTHAKP